MKSLGKLYCLLALIVFSGCNENNNHYSAPAPTYHEPLPTPSAPPAPLPPADTSAPLPTVTMVDWGYPELTDDQILKAIFDQAEFNGPIPLPALPRTSQRAVLFGDNYPGTNMKLKGCVRDAKRVAIYLVRKEGFKPEEIRIILDSACIWQNYEFYLDWAFEPGVYGDRRFAWNSSHGSRGVAEGAETEPDGLNEFIVAYNHDWNNTKTWITDKKLAAKFRKAAGRGMSNWMGSDSCNSGNGARHLIPPNTPAAKKTIVIRSIAIPPWMEERIAKQRRVKRDVAFIEEDFGFMPGCTFDTTCADSQDDEGLPTGAFTDGWLKANYRDNNRPYVSVCTEINRWMDSQGYEQNPQAEGARANTRMLSVDARRRIKIVDRSAVESINENLYDKALKEFEARPRLQCINGTCGRSSWTPLTTYKSKPAQAH